MRGIIEVRGGAKERNRSEADEIFNGEYKAGGTSVAHVAQRQQQGNVHASDSINDAPCLPTLTIGW